MPPSGSDPLKPFVMAPNVLTARITWRPLAGSAPSKQFVLIAKKVTALIELMPPYYQSCK
eukprot:5350091-Amphidinium_carterae.1